MTFLAIRDYNELKHKRKDMDTNKITGTIGKCYYDKGYCFIAGEDKRDYFAHYSFFLRSSIAFRHVREGMSVKFKPVENEDKKKGPKAEDVELAS